MSINIQERDKASLDHAVSLLVEAMEILDNLEYSGSASAAIQSAVDEILIETAQPLTKGLTPQMLRLFEEYGMDPDMEAAGLLVPHLPSDGRTGCHDNDPEPATPRQLDR